MSEGTMNGYNPKLREACARAGAAEPAPQDRPQAATDGRQPVTDAEFVRLCRDELRRNKAAVEWHDRRIGEIDEQIATLKAEAKRERKDRADLRKVAGRLQLAVEAYGEEGPAA